jgi:hypothetical protein
MFIDVPVWKGPTIEIEGKRHATRKARMPHDRRKRFDRRTMSAKKIDQLTHDDIIGRWPRLIAHVICCSLGYATPECAANIVRDYLAKRENWCEWCYSCYNRDPGKVLDHAYCGRHSHQGYMSEYFQAIGIVARKLLFNKSPEFASWF